MADAASSSGTDNPGRLVFATCPDNSTALTHRMIIDNQGNVKTGTVASALNFTDSNSGNTKSIEVGATSGGDALLVTHSSGYGIAYASSMSSSFMTGPESWPLASSSRSTSSITAIWAASLAR